MAGMSGTNLGLNIQDPLLQGFAANCPYAASEMALFQASDKGVTLAALDPRSGTNLDLNVPPTI